MMQTGQMLFPVKPEQIKPPDCFPQTPSIHHQLLHTHKFFSIICMIPFTFINSKLQVHASVSPQLQYIAL